MTSMPLAVTEHAAVQKGNLILSVGGGYSVAGALKGTRKCFVYDTLSNYWFDYSALILACFSSYIGIAGDDVYIAAGFNEGGSTRISTSAMTTFPGPTSYLMEKT
jgi:hypothetical protein